MISQQRAQSKYQERNKEKLLEKARLWHKKARENPEYRKRELSQRKEKYIPKREIIIEKTEGEILVLEKLWDSGFCVCGCRFQGGRES